MKKLTYLFSIAALAAALVMPATGFAQSKAVQVVDGPRVERTGDTWAVVAWTTSTGGSSLIHFGTDPNNLSQLAKAPYSNKNVLAGGHEVHRVLMTGLQPNTTYYIQADSGQGEGTGSDVKSQVQQLHTMPQGQGGPVPNENEVEGKNPGGMASNSGSSSGSQGALAIVNGPRVESTSHDSAQIAWTTSRGGSSIVHYGTDPNNLSQTAQAPYANNNDLKSGHEVHRVKITGLQPNTQYYFQVDSGQGEGSGTQAKGSVQSFRTEANISAGK